MKEMEKPDMQNKWKERIAYSHYKALEAHHKRRANREAFVNEKQRKGIKLNNGNWLCSMSLKKSPGLYEQSECSSVVWPRVGQNLVALIQCVH